MSDGAGVMRKALVIGAEGNVGRPLVRHLRETGCDVLEVDVRPARREGFIVADITQPIDLLPAFDWQPDVVFLLSAMVSRATCEQSGGLALATNLSGLNNVLQLCKRVGAMTVFFSTSEVYGPGCDPMDEAELRPAPNNRYGLSKLLGEQIVQYEARHHGLRAVCLRPFMIYDEEETFGDHRSAMIRFAGNLAQGRPIVVHRGAQRSWLHVSDAVRAIVAAASATDCSVINIGHPDVIEVADLARRIAAELGASAALITSAELPPQMTLRKRPTLTRQRELLGVTPSVPLDAGISRVCRRVRERLAAGERWP